MRAFGMLALAMGMGLLQAAHAEPAALAMDAPTNIDGVETVCTGVGLDARENPLWDQYALKVEVAGSAGRYLGDEIITVRKDGTDLLSLSCAGPWILFQLPPGRYDIVAEMAGDTVSSPAFVSGKGQGRIILRFPDANASYPMTYSDEAARALGIQNGRMDAFSLTPPSGNGLMPKVEGGVDKKGPSLELRWKTN